MTVRPRIGLVGAGAVGTMLAAGLLEHGLRFRWLVRNPARRRQLDIPAIEFDGERRRLAMAPHTVVDSTTELHDCDWLILVVKAQQVVSVLAELPAGCPALVVANGLHTGPFHLGLLYGGAYLALDGTAVFRAGNELWAGPLGLPAEDPAAAGSCLDPLLAQLNSAWLTTHYVPEVRQRMWHKLALNSVVNPLTALLDCPNGALLPWLESPLVQGVLREVAAVAERELGPGGLASLAELQRDLLKLVQATAANSSSMREDLRHGRPTEIRGMNLAVAELGARWGLMHELTRGLGNAVLSIEEANRRG